MQLKKAFFSLWGSRMRRQRLFHLNHSWQSRLEDVSNSIVAQYEGELKVLRQQLAAYQREVGELTGERTKFQEGLKTAFMRGVTALNLEVSGDMMMDDASHLYELSISISYLMFKGNECI